jgi:hypothetical protein
MFKEQITSVLGISDLSELSSPEMTEKAHPSLSGNGNDRKRFDVLFVRISSADIAQQWCGKPGEPESVHQPSVLAVAPAEADEPSGPRMVFNFSNAFRSHPGFLFP